ncbi:acidic mammalian chitinase-like isoform X1 [Neodiprion fabricii]|uniref:acidic mammalian chitinase-like isoform X1 n=1 Tax=Neodiprion fabricii TaxID=2872261 RepID=UPI001ED91088|nr:acidic mammalian chitinase-like isoform X1 [Neodiprion fabricii]
MWMFTTYFLLWLSGSTSAHSHDYKVFCYFGSWSFYRPGKGGFNISDIDPTLCTHMAYAFVGITPNGEVQVLDEYRDLYTDGGLGGFEEFNALRDQNAELKTLVSIGGWSQGSTNFSTVVSNSTLRSTFAKNALEFVLSYNFSGLDCDWEYPAQRGGAKTDVENFVLLLQELRALFDEYDLILSAALGASEGTASISYDIPGISKYLDIVNIMEYDFHGSWDNFTGHNTPLYAARRENTTFEQTLNINASIHYWLDQGAPSEKVLVGTAMYGKTWTLVDSSVHAPGSPVSGVGNAGPYTQENGTLAYYEILKNEAEGNWTVVFDEEQRVPYAYSGDQWVTYDNVKSLTEKVNYVKSLGLGGVSVWAMDLDDFRGLYGEKYPLVKTLNKIINEDSSSSSSSKSDEDSSDESD